MPIRLPGRTRSLHPIRPLWRYLAMKPGHAAWRGMAARSTGDVIMSDPYDLERFVAAQKPVMDEVRQELRQGRKQTHWMWFVFPQIAGLGHSPTARRYALRSLAEAGAFLEHPVLGPRLIECTAQVNAVEGRTVHDIFGSPDDMKFHSSMTLFHRARLQEDAFRITLDRYFDGREDLATLRIL